MPPKMDRQAPRIWPWDSTSAAQSPLLSQVDLENCSLIAKAGAFVCMPKASMPIITNLLALTMTRKLVAPWFNIKY